MPTQEDAIKVFLEAIYYAVYIATQKSMMKRLVEGPPGTVSDPKATTIKNWFLSLDETHQSVFLDAIQETISMSIFNFLVLIDNKAGGYPLKETVSDYAIFLQSYKDEDSLYDYSLSLEAIRLNMSYSPGGDLHDEFMHLLRDQNKDNSAD